MAKKKETVEVTASPEPEAVSAPEVVVAPPAPRVRNEQVAEDKVPFKSWFIMKLNVEKRLKPHHAESLFVYFAGRGLQEQDSPRKFDAALREYFGS